MLSESRQFDDVVDDATVTLLRAKSHAELTRMTSRTFASTREMLRCYLSQLHPTWTHERIHLELHARIHGAR